MTLLSKKVTNRVVILLFLSSILFYCILCSFIVTAKEIEDKYDLAAYFPLTPGMEYSYAGHGIEFAPFERKLMYARDNYLQLTDDNGGTVAVRIYKVTEDAIIELYSEGEFYSEKNIINKIIEDKDKINEKTILKKPFRVGNTWCNPGERREIVAINQKVTVPAGVFYQVIKVKTTYEDNKSTGYEYYAPNVGLIKDEYIANGFEVVSELRAYRNWTEQGE